MATYKKDKNGVYERIVCDRIEISIKIVIDVTDEPEGLSDQTANLLRRLVSKHVDERALAQEDLAFAFIQASPADCTGTCLQESCEALDELHELGALSAEVYPEISNEAAEARLNADIFRRKGKPRTPDGFHLRNPGDPCTCEYDCPNRNDIGGFVDDAPWCECHCHAEEYAQMMRDR
ncbi:MAG: hypothetical protein WCG26_00230 [Chloroflexales bacterium]